jgi:small subunit ribosomal protein S1
LIRRYDLEEGELCDELSQVFDCPEAGAIDDWYKAEKQKFKAGEIITGRVVNIVGDGVLVDVGYKSEGLIPLHEWRDEEGHLRPPRVGDQIQVLLCNIEGEDGSIILSHRKAIRQHIWGRFYSEHSKGDIVEGVVTRKIKGGLLVALDGITAFLPASQIDLRRPTDTAGYLHQPVTCEILSIDPARQAVVVSRRVCLERQRAEAKKKLLAEIEAGQVRQGVVRNIVHFGAFVDLGGVDGLLHITDMAWERVHDPHDVVRVDQPLDVYVISVDREKEKVALGLKQKVPSPWASITERFPVGSRHIGEAVNVASYGVFVRLEPGIEGLVHISEMSWTRRVSHPGELVAAGDKAEVVVLNIDTDKQQLSLSMKQAQANPWDRAAEKYSPNTVVAGTVRNITRFGAFVEIEEGIEGLLHVSAMSTASEDRLREGERVTCVVLNVEPERKRIGLGLPRTQAGPDGG